MKEILIKALNEKGKECLREHHHQKLPMKQKMLFKAMGYSQLLLEEDPYILCLRVCNKRMEEPKHLESLQAEIIKGFPDIELNVDYSVEVKNG